MINWIVLIFGYLVVGFWSSKLLFTLLSGGTEDCENGEIFLWTILCPYTIFAIIVFCIVFGLVFILKHSIMRCVNPLIDYLRKQGY